MTDIVGSPGPTEEVPPVEVVVRGRIARRVRRTFGDALAATAPRPVVYVRGSLRRDPDPAVQEPVHADAAIAYKHRVARAHATARTPIEAIDLLVRHLHREVMEQRRREASTRRRSASYHGTE
jgi:ribosome-associated translation inhibitor RaiA